MRGDLRVDQLAAMRLELLVRPFLVCTHQPRIARHIGGQDRCETADSGHFRQIAKQRVWMPWKECSVVDERLRPHWSIGSCRRMKMRKILNPAVNHTRFEAIFLAGLRKGGMPEE